MTFVELPTVSQVRSMLLPIFWMAKILKLFASTGVRMTITCCVQVALLLCTSVAVQITKFVPPGKLAGALLVTLATAQLSEVAGLPSATPLAHCSPGGLVTVTVAGQVIIGNSLSTTITCCVQVLELPQPSLAVHTTKLVPVKIWAGALLVNVTVPPDRKSTRL